MEWWGGPAPGTPGIVEKTNKVESGVGVGDDDDDDLEEEKTEEVEKIEEVEKTEEVMIIEEGEEKKTEEKEKMKEEAQKEVVEPESSSISDTNDNPKIIQAEKEQTPRTTRNLVTKKEKRPQLCCGGGNGDDCTVSWFV